MPVDPSLCNIVTELVQRLLASATAKQGIWTLEPTKIRKYLQAFHVLDGTWVKTRILTGFVKARAMAGMAGAAWRLHRVRRANTPKRMQRGPGARSPASLEANSTMWRVCLQLSTTTRQQLNFGYRIINFILVAARFLLAFSSSYYDDRYNQFFFLYQLSCT